MTYCDRCGSETGPGGHECIPAIRPDHGSFEREGDIDIDDDGPACCSECGCEVYDWDGDSPAICDECESDI